MDKYGLKEVHLYVVNPNQTTLRDKYNNEIDFQLKPTRKEPFPRRNIIFVGNTEFPPLLSKELFPDSRFSWQELDVSLFYQTGFIKLVFTESPILRPRVKIPDSYDIVASIRNSVALLVRLPEERKEIRFPITKDPTSTLVARYMY